MERKFEPEKFKLAAFDLDNTLIYFGEMSSAVHKALDDLKKTGIYMAVATGRNFGQVTPEVSAHFDAGIYTNGSYTRTKDGKILGLRTIDKDKILKLMYKTRELGGDFFYFVPDYIISSEKFRKLEHLAIESRGLEVNWSKPGQKWLEENVEDTLEAALREKRPFTKIECNFMDDESYGEAARFSESLGLETVRMERYASLEITPNHTNKAVGLREIASHFGVSMDQIIVFGDSANDVKMLQEAGFSVVIDSGEDEPKKFADIVFPPVTQDGAAIAVRELFHI